MDPVALLTSLGPFALALVAAMVFVENGLLFPFLPGDSLMFAAALLSAPLHVSWLLVAAIAATAAVLGGELGFAIGRRFGRRLFRPEARVLTNARLEEADAFFRRWGSPAIVLARFVPIVRTYLAPAAGTSTMPHLRFTGWNLGGALLWALLLGVAGSLLGGVPWIAANVEWIALGIVVVTVGPVLVTALLRRRRRGSGSAESS